MYERTKLYYFSLFFYTQDQLHVEKEITDEIKKVQLFKMSQKLRYHERYNINYFYYLYIV